MKYKKMLIFSLAISSIAVSGITASATQYWDFSINGSELMRTPVYSNLPDFHTPASIGILSGARRWSDIGTDARSYGDTASQANLAALIAGTDDRLAQFNLWGYGGADALGFGEQFQAVEWLNPSSDSLDWMGYFTTEPLASGPVISWATGVVPPSQGNPYMHGLAFGSTSCPDFSFRLGLDDNFNNWYMNNTGHLVATFVGTMVTPNNTMDGLYHGNLILEGTYAGSSAPVPEPATLLLVGTGVAGLAGWRRKKVTQQDAAK